MILKKLKKNATIVFLIMCIVLSFSIQTGATIVAVITTETKNAPEIGSGIGYVLEVNTGTVLYDKDGDVQAYPASITKIMTALLALREGDLNDIVTFSHEAVFSIPYGYSHIALDVGEQLTLEQALYAALLPSANEACYGIAEHMSGTLEAFANKMTETAKSLGATNTNFVNANGLHDENHYTTAHDMALIMREVIKIEKFTEIINTRNYYIPPTNLKEERYILNTNELIKTDSKYYNEYVVGSKTGYTLPAGRTLVTYAKKDNVDIIVVIMQGNGNSVYEDTNTLIDYYLTDAGIVTETANEYENIVIPSEVRQSGVDGKANVNVRPVSSISYLTYANKSEDYVKKLELPEKITTKVNEGDKVGELVVYSNEVAVGRVDLIIDSFSKDIASEAEPTIAGSGDSLEIKKSDFSITNILKWVLIVLGAIILLLFLYARLLEAKIRRYRRRKNKYPSWKHYK